MHGHDSDGSVAVPILIAIAFIVGLGVYHTYIAPMFAPQPHDIADIMPLKR